MKEGCYSRLGSSRPDHQAKAAGLASAGLDPAGQASKQRGGRNLVPAGQEIKRQDRPLPSLFFSFFFLPFSSLSYRPGRPLRLDRAASRAASRWRTAEKRSSNRPGSERAMSSWRSAVKARRPGAGSCRRRPKRRSRMRRRGEGQMNAGERQQRGAGGGDGRARTRQPAACATARGTSRGGQRGGAGKEGQRGGAGGEEAEQAVGRGRRTHANAGPWGGQPRGRRRRSRCGVERRRGAGAARARGHGRRSQPAW